MTTTDKEGNAVNSPLIPDVAGLTGIIHEKLTSNDVAKPSSWDKIVEIIRTDGGNHRNIELLLSQIRLLSSVAGTGTAREMNASELKQLDEDICGIICKEVEKSLPRVRTR